MTSRRLAAAIKLAMALPAGAEEMDRFDLGFRANVIGADGEPTNDIPSVGLYGRYRLDDHWRLGVGVDYSSKFDVERPHEFLGLVGDPESGESEIDAHATSTNLLAWIERAYGAPETRLEWFWSLGGGVGVVDVDALSGPLAGGGSYEIVEDVGTELLAMGMGGLRVRLAKAWTFEAALRLEQHFTDWVVTDLQSGASISLDDYLVRGVHLGIGYRF